MKYFWGHTLRDRAVLCCCSLAETQFQISLLKDITECAPPPPPPPVSRVIPGSVPLCMCKPPRAHVASQPSQNAQGQSKSKTKWPRHKAKPVARAGVTASRHDPRVVWGHAGARV